MTESDGVGVPGVRAIAHTADVGLEIEADTLAGLFDRAARGLHLLVFDHAPLVRGPGTIRVLVAPASDYAMLLRVWLRHLLQLYDDEGLGYGSCEFVDVSPTRLEARITCRPARLEPIREIKGVTLHGLVVEPHEGGWRAQVVFDV